MKPLAGLALGGFRGLSLFRSRWSIGRRSIHHLVPSCGHQTEPSDPPPAADATDPRYVLLNSIHCRRDDGSFAAGAKTAAAESRTFTGRRLRVWFGLAAPPASSHLYYHCEGAVPDDFQLIAAHGGSVLFSMKRKLPSSSMMAFDHFVYRAGTAAGRPPSLSLLPARNFPRHYESVTHPLDPGSRVLQWHDTGLLCRGEDETTVVAQLQVGSDHRGQPGMGDLCELRLGWGQWELRQLPIVVDEGHKPMHWSWGDKTIAVGDRFLCFVDHGSLVLWDAAEEASPKLRYAPMPVRRLDIYSDDLPPLENSSTTGAAGTGALRHVRIASRCCCGGAGRSSCRHSRFAFTVTTWTLTLRTDGPMAWVKDGVLDCEELWAMPGYEGLPRAHLEQPVVSLDNPDVVCFVVSNWFHRVEHEERKAWLIQVDTRKKELVSVVQCTGDPWSERYRIPTRF
ncbi:hypothetical protein ACP70R_004903 [Stipagrostis hirtigluma subsp. patula]